MTTVDQHPTAMTPAERAHVRRLKLAMLAAGLAAFSLLYCTQALLPSIGAAFGVGPAWSSLTVSVATGAVALGLLPMSGLAESLGRPRVMRIGLVAAALLALLGAAVPWFWLLLAVRALTGLALAGVLAVAMGHLGDEMPGSVLGSAMGLYVSGTALGGVLGRVVPGMATDLGSWRLALVVVAACAAVAVLGFVLLLPPTRHFRPTPPRLRAHADAVREVWADPGVRRLCLVGMLAMGGFVACYNYLTYRLVAAPIHLSGTVASLLFLAYLPGTVVSGLSGRLAGRVGRRRMMCGGMVVSVLGLALTLPNQLACIAVGLVLFTCGFFAAHAGASGWVAARTPLHRSHASALYLMAYYLGSSVLGTATGQAWSRGGWPVTVAVIAVCCAGACWSAARVPGSRQGA